MGTPGMSLFGFFDQQIALQYLQTDCELEDNSQESLIKFWANAKSRSMSFHHHKAGKPEIKKISSQYDDYLNKVRQSAHFANCFPDPNTEFKLVEISPIIAIQTHVCLNRSKMYSDKTAGKPNEKEILEQCLPFEGESLKYAINQYGNVIVVNSRSLNMRFVKPIIDTSSMIFGIHCGIGGPWAQVVRHNGKCYLSNGYHRVASLLRAGETHIPCVFRDVGDLANEGFGGFLFDSKVHLSEKPPTCGHFIEGKGYPVVLKNTRRIITLSWSESVIHEID